MDPAQILYESGCLTIALSRSIFRGDLYFPGFINIKTKLRRHTLPQSCHCLPFLFSSSLCSISAFVTSSFSLLVSTEGLHSGHVQWQEEYSFSPLANEVYFHAKITSLFLPSNMVAMETRYCSPTFFFKDLLRFV